jgi:hypothetical protein
MNSANPISMPEQSYMLATTILAIVGTAVRGLRSDKGNCLAKSEFSHIRTEGASTAAFCGIWR